MSQCRLRILDPVKAQQLVQRHRWLRWVAPVAVAGVVAVVATGVVDAQEPKGSSLPATSPAALLADVRSSPADGYSGTVVSSVSLGLPELPDFGAVNGDATSLSSLLTGSHTMEVWYGGPTKQRVALFGSTDETDVFRNGRDIWQWNSANRSAVHTILSTGAHGSSGPTPAPTGTDPSTDPSSMTPEAVAKRALAALDPTTQVQVGASTDVADRNAYTLTLTPRSGSSLIGSVRIAVDGDTKTPLGVTVYPRNSDDPALDVMFTSITFSKPSDRNFTFDPPPDASVRVVQPHHRTRGTTATAPSPVAAPSGSSSASSSAAARPRRKVIGSGWSAVIQLTPSPSRLTTIKKTLMWDSLPTASGSWGSGRIMESTLLTVLVTDDGRVYIGTVDPSAVFAAAGTK